ncbi:MAG: extracellular solute-binding protein [Candidatus Lokiarchaeota archaeon]|nr:extracellular solute-binding protein [Candidatus Lokiarchaeota archaeon]
MSLDISWFSRHKIKLLAIVIIAIVTGSIVGIVLWVTTQQTTKTTLYCYHAGSLTEPYAAYAAMWTSLNPTYSVFNDPYGSSTAIKQCTENEKPTDLIGSADFLLIISMMMEKQVTGQSYNYSDWYIITSKNEMAIAYKAANTPPYLTELLAGTKKWYEVMNGTDVIIGRADPYQDPCGYRTLMTWGLADDYVYGIGEGNWTKNTINQSFYNKDPIIGYAGTGANVVKGKEVDLISTLQAGEIDYLFIYKSVALQQGLSYIGLDPHMALNDSSLTTFYRNVTVSRDSPLIPGASASDVTASPIVYGLTIPNVAPNEAAAIQYVKFMLSNPGVWIDTFQTPVWPYLTNNVSALPTALQPYCVNDPDYGVLY